MLVVISAPWYYHLFFIGFLFLYVFVESFFESLMKINHPRYKKYIEPIFIIILIVFLVTISCLSFINTSLFLSFIAWGFITNATFIGSILVFGLLRMASKIISLKLSGIPTSAKELYQKSKRNVNAKSTVKKLYPHVKDKKRIKRAIEIAQELDKYGENIFPEDLRLKLIEDAINGKI